MTSAGAYISVIEAAEKHLRHESMTTTEAAKARRLARRILKLAQQQRRRTPRTGGKRA